MILSDYINDIKLELTGGIINLEVDDKTLERVVMKALKEIQRYSDETRFMTVPYARCIDLDGSEISRVVSIYRTSADGTTSSNNSTTDPMYAQMWMVYSNGSAMYNLKD